MPVNQYDQPFRRQVRHTRVDENVDIPFREIQQSLDRSTKAYYAGQEMHDKASNFLQVQALDKDKKLRTQLVDSYNQRLEQAVDEYGGDYSKAMGSLRGVSRDIAQDMSMGQLAAIKNNLASYQAYSTGIASDYKEGKISKDQYDYLRTKSMMDYEGVQEAVSDIGDYNSFVGIDSVEEKNIDDRVNKLMEDFAANGGGQIEWKADGRGWMRKKGHTWESVSTKEINSYLSGALRADEELMQSLNRLGEVQNFNDPNFNIEQYIDKEIQGGVSRGATKFGYYKETPVADIKKDWTMDATGGYQPKTNGELNFGHRTTKQYDASLENEDFSDAQAIDEWANGGRDEARKVLENELMMSYARGRVGDAGTEERFLNGMQAEVMDKYSETLDQMLMNDIAIAADEAGIAEGTPDYQDLAASITEKFNANREETATDLFMQDVADGNAPPMNGIELSAQEKLALQRSIMKSNVLDQQMMGRYNNAVTNAESLSGISEDHDRQLNMIAKDYKIKERGQNSKITTTTGDVDVNNEDMLRIGAAMRRIEDNWVGADSAEYDGIIVEDLGRISYGTGETGSRGSKRVSDKTYRVTFPNGETMDIRRSQNENIMGSMMDDHLKNNKRQERYNEVYEESIDANVHQSVETLSFEQMPSYNPDVTSKELTKALTGFTKRQAENLLWSDGATYGGEQKSLEQMALGKGWEPKEGATAFNVSDFEFSTPTFGIEAGSNGTSSAIPINYTVTVETSAGPQSMIVTTDALQLAGAENLLSNSGLMGHISVEKAMRSGKGASIYVQGRPEFGEVGEIGNDGNVYLFKFDENDEYIPGEFTKVSPEEAAQYVNQYYQ